MSLFFLGRSGRRTPRSVSRYPAAAELLRLTAGTVGSARDRYRTESLRGAGDGLSVLTALSGDRAAAELLCVGRRAVRPAGHCSRAEFLSAPGDSLPTPVALGRVAVAAELLRVRRRAVRPAGDGAGAEFLRGAGAPLVRSILGIRLTATDNPSQHHSQGKNLSHSFPFLLQSGSLTARRNAPAALHAAPARVSNS